MESALEQFVTNLRDLAAWEARARTARELLAEMVQSRKEARELAAQHNITWVAGWLRVCRSGVANRQCLCREELASGSAASRAGEAWLNAA